MKSFKTQVLRFIASVPKGKVVSYGQVALACGQPQGAREVGWILRNIDASASKIPWWRVVNNQGVISIKGNWTADKELQARLLRNEGINIGQDLTLEMERYRYGGKS